VIGKSEGAMKPNQTNSKWWLAAILLPVFAFVGGIFFAYGAPHNQSDWFGGAFLGRIFLGLLIGCVLSCVAAVISVAKREKLCWIALLLTLA
jgi:ABC-type transport system involved in multi-copper enzyme maturation permease subunit